MSEKLLEREFLFSVATGVVILVAYLRQEISAEVAIGALSGVSGAFSISRGLAKKSG